MTSGVEPIVRHIKPLHHRSAIGIDTLTITPIDSAGNEYAIVTGVGVPVYVTKTRITSTQPTPTSAAILSCDLSISQPHRLAQNAAKLTQELALNNQGLSDSPSRLTHNELAALSESPSP